jgi:hypothetical protein
VSSRFTDFHHQYLKQDQIQVDRQSEFLLNALAFISQKIDKKSGQKKGSGTPKPFKI